MGWPRSPGALLPVSAWEGCSERNQHPASSSNFWARYRPPHHPPAARAASSSIPFCSRGPLLTAFERGKKAQKHRDFAYTGKYFSGRLCSLAQSTLRAVSTFTLLCGVLGGGREKAPFSLLIPVPFQETSLAVDEQTERGCGLPPDLRDPLQPSLGSLWLIQGRERTLG